MARFSDDPLKNPLAGNEVIPATDPSTGDDIGMTPNLITQFAQINMGLATGSSRGLVTGPNGDKLSALYTKAQFDTMIGELAEVAIPVFFGTPANGTITFYHHPLITTWLLNDGFAAVSAGSTNITITKNGSGLVGAQNIPVTASGIGFTFSDTVPNLTLHSGDELGIVFAGTTGNCANLRVSMEANANISP